MCAVVDDGTTKQTSTTAHIQECHILVGHLLCEGIESGLELA